MIRFYENLIYNLKKNTNNYIDLKLIDKQVEYSYKIAKEIKDISMNKKIINIPDNMNKYLVLDNDYYKLNNYGIALAMTCALFHNIGYILQILNYHEINDEIKDNQEVGLSYLIETKLLKELNIQDQLIIIEVVHNHSRDKINCLDEACEFYVNLVKEAKNKYNNSIINKR